MPRLVSAWMTHEKNRLDSTSPLSLLLQLDIPGAPAPYRLANYDQPIAFHGLVFVASSFHCDALEDTNSLALTRLRLSVENVDQAFISLLENYWTPDTPWDATVWFPVDMTAPDQTPLGTGDVFTVAQVSTDFVAAVGDVMAEGITLTGMVPGRRYTTSGGFLFIPKRLG